HRSHAGRKAASEHHISTYGSFYSCRLSLPIDGVNHPDRRKKNRESLEGPDMNAAFLLEIFPDFLNAAKLTIGISFASAALGALAGYVINAAFLFLPRRLYVLYRVYVWIFRGTPFLVQLFLI